MINFIKMICIWKEKNQMLYPDDVLNMLIENGLTSKYEIDILLSNLDKDSDLLKLPKKYI